VPNPSHILYLHGLGGSPLSSKGVLIEDHFKRYGITTIRPSLSVPSFQELSPLAAVDRVLGALAELSQAPSVAVIGSSFGAFIGMHALSQASESVRAAVARIVLLAPVFDPFDPASRLLNSQKDGEWRAAGVFPLLDLQTGEPTPVHYRFVEELRLLASRPLLLPAPVLVVHGDKDEVVSSAQSVRFADGRPNVELRMVHDTHGLLSDPSQLARIIEDFLLSDKPK